jgi:hypothetical protein
MKEKVLKKVKNIIFTHFFVKKTAKTAQFLGFHFLIFKSFLKSKHFQVQVQKLQSLLEKFGSRPERRNLESVFFSGHFCASFKNLKSVSPKIGGLFFRSQLKSDLKKFQSLSVEGKLKSIFRAKNFPKVKNGNTLFSLISRFFLYDLVGKSDFHGFQKIFIGIL